MQCDPIGLRKHYNRTPNTDYPLSDSARTFGLWQVFLTAHRSPFLRSLLNSFYRAENPVNRKFN